MHDPEHFNPSRFASTAGKAHGFKSHQESEPLSYGSEMALPSDQRNSSVSYSPSGRPDARHVRDSSYFQQRGESVSDIGPSASQVAAPSAVTDSTGAGSDLQHMPPLSAIPAGAATRSDPQQVMLAKQTLVNEELRGEVDNLRRDLERMRLERTLAEVAPPSYEEPHV